MMTSFDWFEGLLPKTVKQEHKNAFDAVHGADACPDGVPSLLMTLTPGSQRTGE